MSVSHMFLSSLKNFFLMRKFIKYSPVGQFPFFQLSTLVISQSSSFLTKQQCSIKLTTSSFLNTFFTWLWCISLSLSYFFPYITGCCFSVISGDYSTSIWSLNIVFSQGSIFEHLYISTISWVLMALNTIYMPQVKAQPRLLTWSLLCLFKTSTRMYNTNLK